MPSRPKMKDLNTVVQLNMKTETFIIPDQATQMQLLEIYELPLSASLQKLCTKICERTKEDSSIHSVVIKVALTLVPTSYHGVPAMFAKTCEGNITSLYPYSQSNKEGTYLIFRASKVKRAATFRARGIQACTEGGIYKIRRDKVPKSYRVRPFLFTKILKEELCRDIVFASNAKTETLSWKVVD